MKIGFVSLGCPKNLIDSEGMSELLASSGYRTIDNPARADVLLVNTCGFLEASKAESIGALQDIRPTEAVEAEQRAEEELAGRG